MDRVVIFKGRTTMVPVSLGFDVSGDTFVSEIRTGKRPTTDLLATWEISFLTDGTDGELLFKLDDSTTAGITKSTGYMDIKRISNGEPLPVLDDVIEVLFKSTVTA